MDWNICFLQTYLMPLNPNICVNMMQIFVGEDMKHGESEEPPNH
jgi:hypothetical protein